MSVDDLRIGLIGLGIRSRQLGRYAHCPGSGGRVVAAAEVRPDLRASADERYPGAQTFDDYRQMLDAVEMDAVIVASPDYLHVEHAVAALEHGLAVYLEKPMATQVEDCDRILDAWQRHGGKLYVGHNMRHMAFVLEMKRLIDTGAIGEVKAAWCRHFIAYGADAYFKDWHSEQRYVNSLLLQKAVHDIDVLHWLCGGITQRVVAMGALTVYDRVTDRRAEDQTPDASWHDENWPPLAQRGLSPTIDVEDLNHVLMQFDNGVLATYQQCHYTPDAWRNYTIIGTEGRIENIGDRPGDCEIRIWNRRVKFTETGNERIAIPESTGGHGGADPKIIAEFLRYARGEVAPSIHPHEARAAVAAAALAAASLRQGVVCQDVPPIPVSQTAAAV